MKFKALLLPAALLLSSGCVSFNSGDVRVSRSDRRRMLDERGVKPAAEIKVVWENFPYKNPTDTIGEGSLNPPKPRPVPVQINDLVWLKDHAEDIFSEAGLYDVRTGSGAITITLLSYGRWTYGEIFRSFLVDTGYIFIIPATLQVNHQLAVEYDGPSGRAGAEEIGRTRTTFHAVLFPLYPLFRPGAQEHSLLKKMLRRAAVDVYTKAKRAAAAAAPPSSLQPAQTPATAPAGAPKTQPPVEETPDD
ncbi:MAG: hypothetical protein WCW52_10120 [Elusimicrobiales bacterium]|jgi:hypothetical protein